MKIRLADLNDAKSISILNNDIQSIHAREHPNIFKPPSEETFPPQEVVDILEKKNNFIYLAQDKDGIIGYVLIEIMNYPENSIRYENNMLCIHHISVKKTHRKKGIGKKLIECAIGLAKKKGISIVISDTWSFNIDASEFFKKQGFTEFNKRIWMNT